jgi:hypothetical protein
MADCCAGKSKAPYDLALIGAGSAGASAAITVGGQGSKTLVRAIAALVAMFGTSVALAASLYPVAYATLELQYRSTMPRVMPSFDKSNGTYLGSGTGQAKGKLGGTVDWDLYEDQSVADLHRTQFVGQITTGDGSKVAFETTGYFVPRPGNAQFWDLTSAVYFSHATGSAYQELNGTIGLWEGHVHIIDPSTYRHSYTIYISAEGGNPARRR